MNRAQVTLYFNKKIDGVNSMIHSMMTIMIVHACTEIP